MKTKQMTFILTGLLISILTLSVSGQIGTRAQKAPDDITKWTNKTIMWIGPHQDDEIK